ncbi:acyl-CoA N-acyltransferase [Ophiobolus disseminans]|uniref:Acyl-CoA N-acyltransferase n=1 Tax=Ophiobolus disseminans TaxID=1469910 RepID=A0A6A6ZT33_9PLEO|nr:acyl-CoA N-acyltransferase [Ophiobolus disseminans]
MPFLLEVAQPDDAPRITQIHMDAFGSNAIIRAIHTAADKDLKDLRNAVEDKLLADMRDARITVLVVRDVKADKAGKVEVSAVNGNNDADARNIVGFAKWIHPYYPQDNYSPPLWSTPKSADWKVLRPWLDEVIKVEEAIIGQTPRYELTYLAVDTAYARKGIGTTLVQWALDRCDAEAFPAYVESTVEAVAFYEKLGFEIAGRISMDIKEVNGDEDAGFYEEVGCIYSPKNRTEVEVPEGMSGAK